MPRHVLLWLTLVLASADARADVPKVQREYCALLVNCGLPPPPGSCSEEASRGIDGVTYDDARCAEAREIASRGLPSQNPDAFAVYRFLGKRYRVNYVVEGDLPMSPARLAYLLDDLPLAAKLLSRLGKNEYTAEYLDETRRRFRGTKEGNLSGEATRVAGSPSERWLVYYGLGRSKVGLWKLRGQSFARFRFAPRPGGEPGLTYSLQILVTPDNGFMNRLMTLGLFRKIVQGQIRQVVDDIDAAGRRLAEKGGAALPGDWTDDERARVEAFLLLP